MGEMVFDKEVEFDKSKIYTAVTADEMHIGDTVYGADNVCALENYVKEESCRDLGKITAINPYSTEYRFEVTNDFTGISKDFALAYLVKKVTVVVPYESMDDMLAHVRKCSAIIRTNYPSVWLRKKTGTWEGDIHLVTGFRESGVVIGNTAYNFEELLAEYEYLDGTPCGQER